MFRRFVPEKMRHQLRRAVDARSCRSAQDKETLGRGSQWTVLTRSLGPESVVFSGGVGEDISFELQLIERFGLKVYIFDPSPVGQATINGALKGCQGLASHLIFHPLGLAGSDSASFAIGGGDGESIWLRTAIDGCGSRMGCTTIPRAMSASSQKHIDLLKLDIEGFEYDVIESCLSSQIPITQICVEFHDFFPEIPRVKTRQTIAALRRAGYVLVHKARHDHTFYRAELL